MMDYQQLLPPILKAAKEAGDIILTYYHCEGDVAFSTKADTSPLTQADLAADRHIQQALTSLTDFHYLSEETKAAPYEARQSWKTFWIVDPLDGTKEFIKKSDEFTVNIALMHEGELVLGVVYAPAKKTMYYGCKGLGAYRQIDQGAVEKLPQPRQDDEVKVVVSKSHLTAQCEQYLQKLKKQFGDKLKTVSSGSSLKFCRLSEGSADIYPRFGPTMEWDTAAGHAVLLYSGGVIQDHALTYNKASLRNGAFIAVGMTTTKAVNYMHAQPD